MKLKLLLFAFIISTYFIAFLDTSIVIPLGQEDGWIESLGAGFFLLASCMLLICFFISGKRDPETEIKKTANYRKFYYLLLALVLFVCFGEEISWGQRIWGWETPESFKAINAQQETNLHNLWMFEPGNPDGSSKSGLEKLFVLASLFSLFTFALFILIPLLNRISSLIHRFIEKIQMPAIPLWYGGLVLINYIVFHIFNFSFSGSPGQFLRALNELKEANYAFVYAVFAFGLLKAIMPFPAKVRWPQRSKKISRASY